MALVALAAVVLVALTTLTHYEVLRQLNDRLPRLKLPARSKVVLVILAAFAAHVLQIALYGLGFYLLVHHGGAGALVGAGDASLGNCLYFSAQSYTSLGFGDLSPTGPVRLLAGVEALNGLLMIAWTASFTYLAMERFWTAGTDAEAD